METPTPTLLYKTADGREFPDETSAVAHNDLLVRVAAFLDHHGVGEGRRKKMTHMLVEWHESLQATEKGLNPG